MSKVQIKNLTKTYGKARGVDNIELDIKEGEIFGFIGPNGAGKSTTIKCIMDLINKNSGEIYVNDQKITRKNVKVREDIGYLPSEIYLYEDLTVEKMLRYSAKFYKKDCSNRINYLVEKLDVDLKKKINELSLGNLKKVGIILALLHEPKILILDEATSGLDPLMQEVFYQLLKEEKAKGTTIFFSSHNLSEVKKICDRVGIIKEGKLIKVDNIKKLTASNFSIVTIYLEEIDKIKENAEIKVLEENEEYIKFIYEKDINKLLEFISKYTIKKLLIEEPSIEDIFIHYYE